MIWSHFTNNNFKLINKFKIDNAEFISYIYKIKNAKRNAKNIFILLKYLTPLLSPVVTEKK